MKHWKLLLVVFILAVACKKPYKPDVIASPNSYLVVEGTISTNDTTTIKLSKTVKLDTNTTLNPVTGAKLVIECDNGANFNLSETSSGTYQFKGPAMDNSRKFRVRITTADNKQYLSDYEQAKNTPPIDSINFTTTPDKLQLFVSSHDPTNNTRYYRFDYAETWKFHVEYFSQYFYNTLTVRPRGPDDLVYYCFAGNKSTTAILGSTVKLKQDVLYEQPLTQVASSAEKISVKYSIIVREYGLSEKEYAFWESLKKNTEQLGSIFDAEPSQLSGNLHNVSKPTEVVIGYVGAGIVSSKRIFIGREQLPHDWRTQNGYECAPLDTLWYKHPKTGENQVRNHIYNGFEIPVQAFYTNGALPAGYYSTPQIPCVDCTTRGVTKQPDFWP